MNKNETAPWQPKVLDLAQIEGAFSCQEGFSRPNWKAIRQTIKETVSPESLGTAWTDVAMQWVRQLRQDLGGKYKVRYSQEFILLSDLEPSVCDELLSFCEKILKQLHGALKDPAWQGANGKHVILIFSEIDDYYKYTSYFHSLGSHPASGGCLIVRDYVHIALPYGSGKSIRAVLAHELAHNSVAHLRLPLWLDEGIATTFERTVSNRRGPLLDHDLRDNHLAFWNEGNIQKYWSGVSFQEPGESNKLSYSLSEIALKLIVEQKGDFGKFVQQSSYKDAGQAAALDCLKVDLGEIMGTFLGEGNWQPDPKAISECWDAAEKEKAQVPGDDQNPQE